VRAFERVLREDPTFASRWIDTLSREVRRLRLQNERLSLPKVQDRVLHLVETEGQKGHYTLNGSLKDLAQQLAVTHEALYRCLAQLQTSGQVVRSPQGLSLG
jgi:CRP-like cAMP-binding protein